MRHPTLEVSIDGIAYTVGREPDAYDLKHRTHLLGFGGRLFILELLEDGRRIPTRNLIYRGTSSGPDTARFCDGAYATTTPGGTTCWQHSTGERA